MTNQEITHVSIIMQLIIDGKANTDNLSPGVREYLEGVVESFLEDPENEANAYLYHFATTVFNTNKKAMN